MPNTYGQVSITSKDRSKVVSVETKGIKNSLPVHILDGSGNQITSFDGTVTANLSAIDNAVLDDIATNTESIKEYINSKIPALGQATMASSLPVTIASDQSAIPVNFPTGSGVDTTVTLTLANTAYAVPAANVPASNYVLLLYNGSDTDMYIRFTTGTTGGIKLPAEATMNIDLGASQTVYAYCSSAGKILNVSHKTM